MLYHKLHRVGHRRARIFTGGRPSLVPPLNRLYSVLGLRWRSGKFFRQFYIERKHLSGSACPKEGLFPGEGTCPGSSVRGLSGGTCSRGDLSYFHGSNVSRVHAMINSRCGGGHRSRSLADRRRSEQQFSRVDTAPSRCVLRFGRRTQNSNSCCDRSRHSSRESSMRREDQAPASAWRRVDRVAVVIDRTATDLRPASASVTVRVSGRTYSVCRSWVAVR